ncbi:A disintegrin and metalloproteinase with thrombospondin motifs 4-like [Acropora millepora]|uniref:A disintegrin and metalloproteinase with thrombospondin motifs 4-like n=1 Tax=Acropora millepora TaxID=45264 RepID=UPI001CF12E5D|nr:A disintegrin and metalloproteinase with thrombospondin motifs 4-like [Acropora millepora]XP_029193762.2 A disintegrin and metalloproteinase with thrombospondin motifs 4-like [Acropora millepora]
MVFGKICVGLVLSVVIFEFAEQVKGRFCDGRRDGDYTNPSNCYGFIACSGGIAYDMPCPAGLKFDEKKDACDYNAPCYQDGGWSAWGPWSNCSVFCGLGRKYRTRTCTNPPPSGGGKDCVGPSRQMRFCYKPHAQDSSARTRAMEIMLILTIVMDSSRAVEVLLITETVPPT